MKTIEFTYTDAKGKVSTRTLVALSGPKDSYEGIDVSNMPADEFGEFLAAYDELHKKQLQELYTLQEKFDLKHNYRKFLTERMTDIKVS